MATFEIKDEMYFTMNASTICKGNKKYKIALTSEGIDLYSTDENNHRHVIIDIDEELEYAIEQLEDKQ